MNAVAWTFNFRWVLWMVGLLGVVIVLRTSVWPSARLREQLKGLELISEKYFLTVLTSFCVIWAAIAWLQKYTQLLTFQLNANDFWLFEDMLRNLSAGGFMLTRFAPQTIGMVQHGAVHSTWSWALGLPLAWVFGPTQAALLYGPLSLGLAAYFLGRIAQAKLGGLSGLGFAFAFLASSSVSKILGYDVHPEVAYPLLVFLWAWSLGLADGRVRWFGLFFATVAGMGVKEDSFLVFFPLLAWAIFHFRGTQRKAAILSGFLAVGSYSFALYSIRQWTTQQWGPAFWNGSPVIVPQGADLIKGAHWSSLSNISLVIQGLIQDHGGFLETLKQGLRFSFSRQLLSILILIPWVLLEASYFWWLVPLIFAYSLLQRATLLNIYYSAPFLGSIWICAILSSRSSRRPVQFALYTLIASCWIGQTSLTLSVPSAEAQTWESRAMAWVRCLPKSTKGLVQTPLIRVVPRDQVLTERVPVQWDGVDFVFLSPNLTSFEMPDHTMQNLLMQLSTSKVWTEVHLEGSDQSGFRLFLKKGLQCRS